SGESAGMPYRLRRPPTRTGHGPLTVYRAVAAAAQPLQQVPQRWVRSQGAYQSLAPNPQPLIASALQAASVPCVDKVWTELAYEAARLDVAPNLPSRLDSLYAYMDPLEALFLHRTDG